MSRKPRSLVSFQDAAMARRGAALIARNAAGLRLRIDPPASRQSRFADKRPTKTETRYAAGAFNNKALHRIEPPIASGKDQGNVDLARKPLRIGSEERLSIEVAHTAVPPVPAHFYSRRAVSRQQLRRFNAVVLSQAALHAVGAVQLHDQRERRTHSQAHSVDDLDKEAGTVPQGTAVLVAAPVEQGAQELAEQVAVRRMQLDAIESGSLSTSRLLATARPG